MNGDKKRTINEEDFSNLVENDIMAARSHADNMSSWRQSIFNEYRAMPYGDEVEGRSEVVATDMQDAVEWIMPSLMRIFAGTQQAVKISGVGPEDEDKAKKMHSLIYYQLQKLNPYFKIIYCWFKNALRFKTAIVKATWRYDYDLEDIEYKDLSLEEFLIIKNEPFVDVLEFKVKEQVESAEGMPPVQAPLMFESVKVRAKSVLFDGPVIENVKPETFYIDPEATSIKDADYCGQILQMTASELRKRVGTMGFIESRVNEAIEKGPGGNVVDVSTEAEYRLSASDLSQERNNYEETDARAKFEVFEHFCKMDVDGDGIVEDWLVYKCNGFILFDKENKYGRFPFFDLSPIIEPHSFYGVSIIELVRDVQRIKTSLYRLMFDNMAFAVNGRFAVLDGYVKIQDLIHNNVPGGIIRQDRDKAVTPLETPRLPQEAFQLLEFIEGAKENRTGVTRYNQGLDSGSLNKTATGLTTIYNASLQRIELIARIFAETGFMDLVRALIDYNRRFFNREVQVRMFNEATIVTPEDCNGYFDYDVSVGVGNIDDRQRASSLVMGMQMTAQLFGASAAKQLTAIMREWWAASGFKNSELFVPDENSLPQGGALGPGTGTTKGSPVGGGSEVPSNSPVAPQTAQGFEGANNFQLA